MLAGLKGRTLLEGYRGAPPVNMKALAKTVLELARFGSEIAPCFESVDFNPVIATPGGTCVVDAKVVLAPGERPDPFALRRAPHAAHATRSSLPRASRWSARPRGRAR